MKLLQLVALAVVTMHANAVVKVLTADNFAESTAEGLWLLDFYAVRVCLLHIGRYYTYIELIHIRYGLMHQCDGFL